MTLAHAGEVPPGKPASLRAARAARRPARLLRLHRLHRARRDGDRRRRLVLAQPDRWAGARGPRHSRRRSRVLADPSRGRRRRAQLPRIPRPAFGRRHHAGDGAHRRRPPGIGRAQGGRRRLSAVRHGGARSRHAARRTRSRRATAPSARRSIRRCWRGSILRPARGSPSAPRPSRSPPCSRPNRTSSPAASPSARA